MLQLGYDREEYLAVLQSKEWKQLRGVVYREQRGLCARCDHRFRLSEMELHHLHYDNLGMETVEDVELLCKVCHLICDRKRIIEKSIHTFMLRYWENTRGKNCPQDVLDQWVENVLLPGLPTPQERGLLQVTERTIQKPKKKPKLRYIQPGGYEK